MPQQQTNERIKERTRYNFPKLYKVIIFNDEITTMDFVVMILRKVFTRMRERLKGLCWMSTTTDRP